MASLRCHGDADCNKTQIIRNFHLYIIQLWQLFFHILIHGDVVNAQTWEVSPRKIQSSHLKSRHCSFMCLQFVLRTLLLNILTGCSALALLHSF